ncbi:MAG: hypothetical protein A2474_08450 [Elusimicrobia bacterium RIFOXYC2_FULL_34_12]|nr:MAG: hypothetical protein A2474_08450 [Elusimicrobia bacterium RIFOXYC2_FULL_34_12]OGS39580.1 MAG: hypothetical protein A2551_01365 [Elusimicrobia bacterium RIFOXYD2_FULL_34_30]HAM38585.1 hypothetical protein [Elusimicrobiota bacterium]
MEKQIKIAKKLDLTGVICPTNFVKTKLALEDLKKGQILEIILDDGEPIRNVPRSIKEDGHKIIKVENIKNKFKILIKK